MTPRSSGTRPGAPVGRGHVEGPAESRKGVPDQVLRIQLAKHADGTVVLRCIRADGSTVWQRQRGPRGAFFPLHDLTHFAVESVLRFRDGFFGLIADGWSIEDTEGRGARGPLPPEALLVERLVGLLDVERASNARWTASEVIAQLALAGVTAPPVLTDSALDEVRARRGELFARWADLAPGESLELIFERPPASAA